MEQKVKMDAFWVLFYKIRKLMEKINNFAK